VTPLVSASPTAAGTSPRRSSRAARRLTFLITLCSAVAFVSGYQPPRPLEHAPFVVDSAFGTLAADVEPARDAYGRSDAVWMRTALPGQAVEYPVDLRGPTTGVRYSWETVPDLVSTDSTYALDGGRLIAPTQPGFYQLVIHRDSARVTVPGPTLAVLVPFVEKRGPVLDGYRIGMYDGERHSVDSADTAGTPEGFLKVMPDEMDLPISRHLRLGDFLTQDGQTTWPRFVALSPRVLDKLELVVERLAHATRDGALHYTVYVHSAFRTPAHNRLVRRAAPDSRHQFGDAVDVAIDANSDGRVTAADARLVAAAVDSVEAEYPELTGGMGLYVSRHYHHPYVHIDARGTRVRWRG
jgi:hypothetical protein